METERIFGTDEVWKRAWERYRDGKIFRMGQMEERLIEKLNH